ncbi:MAG: hypothetical protein A2085_06620 [Gemmatimonadetes bacterium GWC2_71_10]|nr:MAG: hypothetical protein A2085_06620 [Gemmatimonadetes bacterium GWC2_71_10]
MTWRAGAAALVAAALLTAAPAAAQSARNERRDLAAAEWRTSLLVYPLWDALDGVSGYVAIGRRLPPRRGPFPTTAGFELAGRLSTSGSRGLLVAFDAPGLWPGWRVLGIVAADRFQRAPYFGLGNAPDDSVPQSRRFYRYSLRRYSGFAAVQRDLVRHLRAHAGVQVRAYRALPLEGDPTLLAADLATGAAADTGSRSGTELRLGLLYDTRDEEASPSRGVFLEALIARGMADLAYDRYLLSAREFIPLGEYTTLGFRQSLELAGGAMPFYVMYERFTSWRPEDGFGGPTSLRNHLPGRFLAPNRAMVSADLRFKKIDVPIAASPFRLWYVAFADAGRLWLDGERPSLSGLHWDAGVGAIAQFSKSAMFGLNIGFSGIDGFEFGGAISFGF